MLVSSRPYGAVIRPGSPTKLRGAVLLQASGQWPWWAQFWRDFDWPTIKGTIDALSLLGVNCIQVTATGQNDGYPVVTHPDVPTMRAHIGQLAGYCASKGMMLNPQLGYQAQVQFAGGTLIPATAQAVSMAKLFAEQPNIAFIDALNEANIFVPSAWGSTSAPTAQAAIDLGYFTTQIRAVIGAIPLTVSVGCSSTVAEVGGPWMQAMAPLCDFHNVHTYYPDGATPSAPSAVDFAGLRAASWYLGRFVVGETGMSVSHGSAAQTAWLTGNGAVAAGADCLGSIIWGAMDTQHGGSPSEPYEVGGFGMLNTDFSVRSALSGPVSAWPAAL